MLLFQWDIFILQIEITQTSFEFMILISDHIHIKQRDIFAHPCINFNNDVTISVRLSSDIGEIHTSTLGEIHTSTYIHNMYEQYIHCKW